MDPVTFNDIGFLSPDLTVWAANVRKEFANEFKTADLFNRLAMRMLFEIPTEEISEEQALGAAAYGRAVQAFQVAVLLCERGVLAEARAITRLCAEAVIAVGGLKNVPGTVDALREDLHCQRKALANSVLAGVDGERPDDPSSTRLRSVLAGIEETYGERKLNPIRWAVLADQAGLKGLYDIAYRLTSGDAAHVGIGALNRHIVADDNNEFDGYKFHPDKSDLNSTLFAATASMAHLFGLMLDWYDLSGFRADVAACIERWKTLSDGD